MGTFKVGQKVRCVDAHGSPSKYYGLEGVIINRSGGVFDVKFNDGTVWSHVENTIEALANASTFSTQVGGSHYKDMKIQPTEYIMANGMGFAEGNVIKYVSRYKNKNGVQDLKKARHYLDMLIEQEEKNGNAA